MNRGAFALVLLAALTAVGCGTLANHNPEVSYANCTFRPNRIYGGVRVDAEVLATPVDRLARGQSLLADHAELPGEVPSQEEKIVAGVMLKPTVLLDLPLSFIADTIMLPWDIAAQWTQAVPKELKQPSEPSRLVERPVEANKPANTWQISGRIERPAIPTSETPQAAPPAQR